MFEIEIKWSLLQIEQSSKSASIPLDPSHSASTVPTNVLSHSASTIPTEVPSHSAPTVPTEVPSHSASTVPTEVPSHSASTVPTNVPSHSASTVPTNVPSHSASTVPTNVPSHSASTIPTEVPSHSGSTVPTNITSHSASTVPMEVPSHSTVTVPMEITSHSTVTVPKERPPQSAPVEPFHANTDVTEPSSNSNSVIHLRDTLSHLTESALPYRPPVEPYHPSMPYHFNANSSQYNGKPITTSFMCMKLAAKLHDIQSDACLFVVWCTNPEMSFTKHGNVVQDSLMCSILMFITF